MHKFCACFLMTSSCDSHTTTDVILEMKPDVQTGNGITHDKYNIRGIAHARTIRKDDIFIYWSGGKGLVNNQNHTRPELTQP